MKKLRCHDGDLAVVIREVPGMEPNLGRFVWVYGPWREHPGLGPVWGISAARCEPLVPGADKLAVGTLQFHPDDWLLSVRCRRVRHLRPPRSHALPVLTPESIERLSKRTGP